MTKHMLKVGDLVRPIRRGLAYEENHGVGLVVDSYTWYRLEDAVTGRVQTRYSFQVYYFKSGKTISGDLSILEKIRETE